MAVCTGGAVCSAVSGVVCFLMMSGPELDKTKLRVEHRPEEQKFSIALPEVE